MSPAETSTFERVRSILASEFAVAPELLDPAARLDQLAIDSLAVIEVMFRLEDEFKIAFTQDTAQWTQQIQTIGDLVSCVDQLVTASRTSVSSASGGSGGSGAEDPR